MYQNSQSGRSMLEMLAVLGIIGLITVSGIFIFNNLFKRYQTNETTKEMNELVTRYRSDRLTRKRNGKVVIKDLMPSANTKNSDTMITANNGTLQLVDNGNSGDFVVIVTNLGFSCQDILLQGNYDGVLKEGEEVFSPDDIKNQNIEQLKALCNQKELKFLYSNEECNYYIDGECSECKKGEEIALLPEGGNGCCRTNSINECGYCGKCPDDKKCNPTTKQCTECIDKCPGTQVCDEGTCVDCTKDSDCQGVDMHCTSLKKCEICDSRFQEWRNGICVCKKIRPKLNEACSVDCGCQGDLDCVNGTCQAGQCTNEPQKTHWNGVECVCPSPKSYYNETTKKCECPLGTTEQGEDCVPSLGTTCENTLRKGDDCSTLSQYPNNCCGVGLSCNNGKCQCNAIPTTPGADCDPDCECAKGTDLHCENNKCVCMDPKEWDATQGKCVCKKPDDTNKDKDCYEKVYPNKTECPEYYKYVPKSEGTRCNGACHSCDNNGNCIDRTTPWSGKVWGATNSNCCSESNGTYCPLNGESAPTTCSGNKTQTSSSSETCVTITSVTDLCTNTTSESGRVSQNEGGSCGACGTCSNGTCNDPGYTKETFYHMVNGVCVNEEVSYCPGNRPSECTPQVCTPNTACGACGICNSTGTLCNDPGMQSYTYMKLVNGVCTSVTESFCPANAPTDQCTPTTQPGCPEGSTWDSTENACVAPVTLSGQCTKETVSVGCWRDCILYITFPTDIKTGTWQILGNDEKAKISASVKVGPICSRRSGEFTLSNNTISFNGPSVSGLSKYHKGDMPCTENPSTGQNLYKEAPVKSKNVIIVEIKAGADCLLYSSTQGSVDISSSSVRVKLL